MNVLVDFRANALGNLSVTHRQQQEAHADITSTYRAKMAALSRNTAAAKQAGNSPPPSLANPDGNELGRDAFLQLLVLELQNQDPLEPVDNAEMVAQLAQFSSLEQMEKLNGSFELLAGNVDQLNFISAQGMLGRHIEGVNEGGQAVTGTVDSVYLDGSIVMLNVSGEIVPMSGVLSITGQGPGQLSGEAEDSDAKKR